LYFAYRDKKVVRCLCAFSCAASEAVEQNGGICLKKLRKQINTLFTFNSDIKNRFNGFRNYYIAKHLQHLSKIQEKMLGCNMAYWRRCFKKNGYENNLTVGTEEDEEFATRLINNSIYKIK
jgi:hypothetical protein